MIMTSEDYIKLVKRTESPTFGDVNQRIMHGVIGCVTEAGEMMDAMKKCLFYGRTLDKDNLKEEIGDVFWYLGILCDELGVTFEEIQSMNIRKLRKRYPEQFKDVVIRDYEGEMEAAKKEEDVDMWEDDDDEDDGDVWSDVDEEKEPKKEPDKPIDQQASRVPHCFGYIVLDDPSKEGTTCLGCLSRGPCVREALQQMPPKEEEERPVPRCFRTYDTKYALCQTDCTVRTLCKAETPE